MSADQSGRVSPCPDCGTEREDISKNPAKYAWWCGQCGVIEHRWLEIAPARTPSPAAKDSADSAPQGPS